MILFEPQAPDLLRWSFAFHRPEREDVPRVLLAHFPVARGRKEKSVQGFWDLFFRVRAVELANGAARHSVKESR